MTDDTSPADQSPTDDELARYFVESAEQSDTWGADYHSRVLAEYATTVDVRLMSSGWAFDAAKSVTFFEEHYDQSLLSHTRGYVTALVRLNALAPERVRADEAELRCLVAMGVVHDIHKLNDSDDEFNISLDTVNAFAETVNLYEFAPDLTERDLHAAAVGMHKGRRDDLGRRKKWAGYKGRLNTRFLNYRDLLRLADKCASVVEPNEFIDTTAPSLVRNAYFDDGYTTHAHTVQGISGPLLSLINAAVHDVLTDRGYDLLEVYETGCTYVEPNPNGIESDADARADPFDGDGPAFVNAVYEAFQTRLQAAYPSYRNTELLTEVATPVRGKDYYRIDDIDVFVLPPEDVLRAIIQRGVVDTTSPFDISQTAHNEIELIEDATEVTLTKSYRLVGLARIVHTLWKHVVRDHLVVKDGEDFECSDLLALFSLLEPRADPDDGEAGEIFGPFAKYRRIFAETWARHELGDGESLRAGDDFPYKYLIAQALLEHYYTGESEEEIAVTMSERVIDAAQQFTRWEEFRANQVADVDQELRAVIGRTIRVDDESPLTVGAGIDAFDEFISADKHTCGVCGVETTEIPRKGRPRLSKVDGDESRILINGKPTPLKRPYYNDAVCFACQLDISIRREHGEWADDNAFHVHLRPNYSYSPISQTIFDLTLERLNSIAARQGNDFTNAIFHPDDLSWYETALNEVIEGASGADMLTNLENAFSVDNGFGTLARQYPLPEGVAGADKLVMGVFSATTAAMYAGVQVRMTRHPVVGTSAQTDMREIVDLAQGFDRVHYLFGRRLPLADAPRVLRQVAAIKQLTAELGAVQRPLTTYHEYARDHVFPGAALLHDIRCNGGDVSEYAEQAAQLDAVAIEGDTYLGGIAHTARALGPLARHALSPAHRDDGDAIARLVAASTTAITTAPATDSTPALKRRVREFLAESDETAIHTQNAFDAHEYASVLVDLGLNEACAGKIETFKQAVPLLTRTTIPAAFTTTDRSVATSPPEHESTQDAGEALSSPVASVCD